MTTRARTLTPAAIALPSALALAACSEPAQNADPRAQAMALLETHVEAIGGEAAYAALNNLRLEVEIVEQGALLKGDYRATRDGRMRVDVYYEGERIFSEGIDAQGAWQQAGEGQPIEGMGAVPEARLRRGITSRFHSLAKIAGDARSVRLLAPQQRGDKQFDAVEIVASDGHARTWLFDRDSGIAVRMLEREAHHPDIDPTENNEEEVDSDFSEYCGLLLPTRSVTTNRDTGEELDASRLVSARCNLGEDSLEIDRPTAGSSTD